MLYWALMLSDVQVLPTMTWAMWSPLQQCLAATQGTWLPLWRLPTQQTPSQPEAHMAMKAAQQAVADLLVRPTL